MKIKRIKNSKDLYINYEKFPNKSKILLITGLSGSGKSTLAEELAKKYNATCFQVEWLIHAKHTTPECSYILDNFMKCYPEIIELVSNKWNNCKSEDKNQLLKKYINMFFQFFLKNKDENKLYIVEGLQLFTLIDFDILKNFPIIIKGTSSIQSLKNRLKRDLKRKKTLSRSARIKYFFKVIRQSRTYQFKHRKKLNKFIKKYENKKA